MFKLSLIQYVLQSPQQNLEIQKPARLWQNCPYLQKKNKCSCIACSHAPNMSIFLRKHLSPPPPNQWQIKTTSLSLIHVHVNKQLCREEMFVPSCVHSHVVPIWNLCAQGTFSYHIIWNNIHKFMYGTEEWLFKKKNLTHVISLNLITNTLRIIFYTLETKIECYLKTKRIRLKGNLFTIDTSFPPLVNTLK